MNQPPLSLALNKEAGLLDAVPEFLWHHDRGPLENIFTWLNRFMVVFSGGTLSLVMMAATAAGYSLGDLGRELDELFGLKDLSDLRKVDPNSLTEKATSLIMSKVGGQLGSAHSMRATNELIALSYVKLAADPDWFAPPESEGEETEFRPSHPSEEPTPIAAPSSEGLEEAELTPYQRKMMEERRQGREDRLRELERRRTERMEAVERGRKSFEQKQRERQEELERKKSERAEVLAREEAEMQRQNLSEKEKHEHQVNIINLKRQQELEDREYKEQQVAAERERQEHAERTRKQEMTEERERAAEKEKQERERSEIESEKDRKYREKMDAKRMKAQRELTQYRLPGGRGFFSGAGKAALGIGLTGLIGYIFKSFTDPSSWLARALRGIGLYGAERLDHPGSSSTERKREDRPGGSSPEGETNDYKAGLEKAFDDVLGR